MENVKTPEETLKQKITIITLFVSAILGLFYGLHYIPALVKMMQ